jgi:hypothetical protein
MTNVYSSVLPVRFHIADVRRCLKRVDTAPAYQRFAGARRLYHRSSFSRLKDSMVGRRRNVQEQNLETRSRILQCARDFRSDPRRFFWLVDALYAHSLLPEAGTDALAIGE